MAGNETEAHKELKHSQLCDGRRKQGYSCCGFEIRLPNSGYRADVAAYKPAYEQCRR